ncbi:hypothetical protein PORY_000240 [Pneumocystis oryctolagi]|uniref:Uncharacterized protein n=1 Tax=Pneumocystis oryctolagi TaxID=42067 RepID=A0ACB7CHF2_9ASCO|nr:hypothetical protein PORY_000240 [Pneumocystis oryctolagi]
MYQMAKVLHCSPLRLTVYPIYRSFHTISLWNDLFSLVRASLYVVHDTGMPWWVTIPITTLFVRTAMLPVVFWSRNRMIRYAYIKPLIKAWEFQNAKSSNDGNVKKVKLLFRDHSCHPIGSLVLPLIQIPLFFIMTSILRGMSGWSFSLFQGSNIPIEASLAYEGIGWIHDLTVSDPIGFFPVCLGLINFINIQLNLHFYKEIAHVPTFLIRLAQGNVLVFIFFSMQVPAVMNDYHCKNTIND